VREHWRFNVWMQVAKLKVQRITRINELARGGAPGYINIAPLGLFLLTSMRNKFLQGHYLNLTHKRAFYLVLHKVKLKKG